MPFLRNSSADIERRLVRVRHQYPETIEEAEAALDVLGLPVTLDYTVKASNPKDLVGSGKLPLHLWPTTATALGCLGMLDGMLKYGRSNWRFAGVRYSVYHDAVTRHLNAAWEGEECDPDSGLPHLSHALACLAIIVDAEAHGKLIDDRAYAETDGYRQQVEALTPHVERLKEKHASKDPKHYTIKDVRP